MSTVSFDPFKIQILKYKLQTWFVLCFLWTELLQKEKDSTIKPVFYLLYCLLPTM